MTNTINISVTNGNMSPRFIEVGAEGQEGIIKLSLSFDDGWSGLAKSVVFYDKRRIKTVSYDFLGFDSCEVEIPSVILSEDGRHPFIIVGSEIVGDDVVTAREIPRKITECAFICVGDSIYPELNSTAIEALDTDAYSSFLEAYFGCLATAEELKGQYSGLTGKVGEAEGYANSAKSYAVGGTGTRENEGTDNAKHYSELSGASATEAKASEKAANDAKEIAVGKAEETKKALSDMRSMYSQGQSDISAQREAAEKAKVAAEKAKTDAEKAKNDASGYAATCGENASNSGLHANTAWASADKAQSYAVGHTGTRDNENTDNAKYYSEVAKNAAVDLETSVASAEAFKVAAQKSAEDANAAYESASEIIGAATEEVNAAKAKTFEARDDAFYAKDKAESARNEAVEVSEKLSGTLCYMGEVDVLPENAEKGQVYKLSADYTSGHYEVPTTDVSGIYTNNPSEGYSNIQADGAVKALLEYVYTGVSLGSYGDFPNYHYYYNGQRYSIPAVTSYGRDGIIIYADARFESLLLSGEPIVCDLTRVDAMPIVLVNCFAGIKGTKGMCFVWDGAEWKSLDADSATLADKSVTTDKIADLAITSPKIANYAVTADKLSPAAITSSKINGIIAVGKGGTGRSKWDAYKMIYPSSATAFAQLDLPTAESVLCQKTSGAPYWKFLSEIGGSGSSGGYKKIGYTDDCDYKVSASSGGKAAFEAAISAASDGDTILVLAGDYGGSGTLNITKNLTFVGIGMPNVMFAINVSKTGTSDSYTFYTANFFAMTLANVDADYDSDNYSGKSEANICSCYVTGSASFGGTAINTVFSDTVSNPSFLCVINMYNCKIAKSYLEMSNGDKFDGCNITVPDSVTSTTSTYGGYLKNCTIYLPQGFQSLSGYQGVNNCTFIASGSISISTQDGTPETMSGNRQIQYSTI